MTNFTEVKCNPFSVGDLIHMKRCQTIHGEVTGTGFMFDRHLIDVRVVSGEEPYMIYETLPSNWEKEGPHV